MPQISANSRNSEENQYLQDISRKHRISKFDTKQRLSIAPIMERIAKSINLYLYLISYKMSAYARKLKGGLRNFH